MKLRQGTFSFLPDLTDAEIHTQVQYCIDNGIELFFHLRRHQYSSTELRNRVYELEKKKREEKIESNVEQYSPELLEKYSLKDNDQGKM